MIRSNNLNSRGEELIATFPTRFFVTAEEAMARSSLEISGSSRVFVLPSGAFTWTDGDGQWIHPEFGTTHPLTDFYDIPVDEHGDRDDDAPIATEVADRVTTDDPFADNFGSWTFVDGEEVDTRLADPAPQPVPWR